MTDVILSSLSEGYAKQHQIEDIKYQAKKISFIRNLFHSRIKPLYIIFTSLVKRKLYKKNGLAIYFGIEDYKGLAAGFSEFGMFSRQAIWLWNPRKALNISEFEFIILIKSLMITGVDIWTFDFNDAKKYKLKYHPQIYSESLSKENIKLKSTDNRIYDAFFIGVDKGRISILNSLAHVFDTLKLKYMFHVLPDANREYANKTRFITDKHFSYEEYLDALFNSNILVEIVQAGQNGITIRALESVFYNKKMITNNASIIEYDFYHPNNIFVFTDDNIQSEQIKKFLNMPYVMVEPRILEKYDIKHLIDEIMRTSNLDYHL
ncbi:hypothetical protein [Citrobacter sedlakii]